MTSNHTIHRILRSVAFAAALSALPSVASFAQQADPASDPAAAAAAEDARADYKANDMLNKGIEMIQAGQTERGSKLIASIPDNFPNSKVRFKAYLAMGQYLRTTRQFDLAIRQFAKVADSQDPAEQAEALYQTGICYYDLSDFNSAFVALRRVTNEHAWSVFANEAYYYIGQCHFKLGRWSKAIEALEMVGTSVEPNRDTQILAEAGQRLYIKVRDQDLVILRTTSQTTTADVTTASGDSEKVTLTPLGQTGEYYIGSIQTVPAAPKPGDGLLQISGGDQVTIRYNDENTQDGHLNEPRTAQVRMVSTASVGFTDGAYQSYASGIFADNPAFIRVKDLDRDTTDNRDSLSVRVHSQYKAQRDEPAERTGVDLDDEPQWITRDSITLQLTEKDPRGGIFTATFTPRLAKRSDEIDTSDTTLSVMQGDDIIVTYEDQTHALAGGPRTISYPAKVVLGQIQDVKIIQQVVDSVDLKARKDLIEARVFLRLGEIFKDVGLVQKANEKADEGLYRVNDVIATSSRASLDRELIEEAFSIKWDLLLVQDRLKEAIDVCQTLTRLFPDSTLVDRALLKIGLARMAGDTPYEAISIFNAVLRLPKSDLKAEAQYRIGEVMEKAAIEDAAKRKGTPILTNALRAYRTCAETYPGSPFAGDALDKITNYYITAGDYPRAIALMERIVSEYPDAGFLDRVLLKWVIASYRTGDYTSARRRAMQLISEYPKSASADKARDFLETINRKTASDAAQSATP